MASAEFDGLEAIKAKLQRVLDAKDDALKAAGLVILTESQKSIINSGPGWPGFKRPPKRAHQLLWLSATLLRSLALGGADNVMEQSGDTITLGSNVRYAKWQNEGTEDGHIPARPFLYTSEERLQLATQAYIATLTKAWQKS